MPAAPSTILTGLHEGGSRLAHDFRALTLASQNLANGFNPVFNGLQTLSTGFKIAGASLTGLIYFGGRGSAEMNRLAFETQRAARELASAFVPAIRKVTEAIARLADRFHAMTGVQQQAIRNTTLSFLAAGAVATGFVRLVSSLAAFKTALDAAKVTGALGTGVGGTGLGVFGAVTVGLFALLGATREGREALHDLFEAFKPVVLALGSVAAAFGRALVPVAQALAAAVEAVIPLFKLLADAIAFAVNQLKPPDIANIRGGAGTLANLKGIDLARGGNRDAFTQPAGGAEDTRAIIGRLQQASNKTDYQRKTAENTEGLVGVLKIIADLLKAQGRHRPQPRV